jgi:hypothetical protein
MITTYPVNDYGVCGRSEQCRFLTEFTNSSTFSAAPDGNKSRSRKPRS